MAVENVELVHEYCPQHLCVHGNNKGKKSKKQRSERTENLQEDYLLLLLLLFTF